MLWEKLSCALDILIALQINNWTRDEKKEN